MEAHCQGQSNNNTSVPPTPYKICQKKCCHFKITKGDCQTFFRKLLEQRENLKKNTLIKIKQTMSSIFKSRDEEQNPTRGMNFSDLYKNSNNEIEKKEMILRDEELKIVLDKVKETKDKTFITVIYTTLFLCLRRGEVSCLRVSDIDFKNKCIHIRKSLVQVGKKQIIQNGTKNGEQRIVPLFPEIEVLLKDFLAYKKEQNIPQKFDDKGKETTFLFTKKDGELPYIETFPKKFKKLINELNKDDLLELSPSFHSLRGSGISYWVMERNIDIPIVQKFAGHKDISTTLKYYIKVTDKEIRELSDKGITGDFF